MQDPIVLPQRKQLRLLGYDYAFPGAYFVTICSAGKRPVFGSVSERTIVLSQTGEIVRAEWIALTERFSRMVLDEFVITICMEFWRLWAVREAQAPPLHCLR